MRRAEARLRRHVAACRIQAAARGWHVRHAMAIAKQARTTYAQPLLCLHEVIADESMLGSLSFEEQRIH